MQQQKELVLATHGSPVLLEILNCHPDRVFFMARPAEDTTALLVALNTTSSAMASIRQDAAEINYQ